MPDYPIVKYPLAFASLLQELPPPPVPPAPASLPVYPVRAVVTLGRAAWVLLLILGASLLIADRELEALVVGLLLVVGWRWAERRAARQHQGKVEAYHAAFQRYVNVADVQQEHERALSVHAYHTMPGYYARHMAPLLSGRSLLLQPIPNTETRPAEGRSERAFGSCLAQHFGERHILTGCRVPVAEAGTTGKWYYPDFVYCDSSGLCIDIEIDEPYAWTSREATHYQGKDDKRNGFFLRHHWAVVRFTEEQVVRYPHLCCQELAALIFYLSGRSYAARLYQERLPRTPQ